MADPNALPAIAAETPDQSLSPLPLGREVGKGTGATFKFLHLDVVEQIFIRLPVCSIGKCMCVCKQWYSLIKSQEFATTHIFHRINNSPPNFLIGVGNLTPRRDFFTLYSGDGVSCLLRKISSPFCLKKHDGLGLRVVGSVHGLICVNIYCSNSNSYIWNPLINRYLEVPNSNTYFKTSSHYGILGFGFASLTNDYKVVRLVFVKSRQSPWRCRHVDIYSMRERLWRECPWRELDVSKVKPFVIERENSSSCFTNGAVHWIAGENLEKSRRWFICSFDMNNECFNRIDLPHELSRAIIYDLRISDANGSLSIFHNNVSGYGYYLMSCDIWVKRDSKTENSWIKTRNIDFKGMIRPRILNLRDNGEVLIEKSWDEEENGLELASYDPKTKAIKSLGVQSTYSIFYSGPYCESLLLLDTRAVSLVKTDKRSGDTSCSKNDKGRRKRLKR